MPSGPSLCLQYGLLHIHNIPIQWNLHCADTIGTKKIIAENTYNDYYNYYTEIIIIILIIMCVCVTTYTPVLPRVHTFNS